MPIFNKQVLYVRYLSYHLYYYRLLYSLLLLSYYYLIIIIFIIIDIYPFRFLHLSIFGFQALFEFIPSFFFEIRSETGNSARLLGGLSKLVSRYAFASQARSNTDFVCIIVCTTRCGRKRPTSIV